TVLISRNPVPSVIRARNCTWRKPLIRSPPQIGCNTVGVNQPNRSVLSGIASPQPLSEKSLVRNCCKMGMSTGDQTRKATPLRRQKAETRDQRPETGDQP